MKLYFANVITICCLYSPMMAALPEAINHSAATRPTESTVSSKPTDSTVTIQQADTVRQKTTQLDEVVVNSDGQWRDGEKYVFLPQKDRRTLRRMPLRCLNACIFPC